jgi:hypothetical protein
MTVAASAASVSCQANVSCQTNILILSGQCLLGTVVLVRLLLYLDNLHQRFHCIIHSQSSKYRSPLCQTLFWKGEILAFEESVPK